MDIGAFKFKHYLRWSSPSELRTVICLKYIMSRLWILDLTIGNTYCSNICNHVASHQSLSLLQHCIHKHIQEIYTLGLCMLRSHIKTLPSLDSKSYIMLRHCQFDILRQCWLCGNIWSIKSWSVECKSLVCFGWLVGEKGKMQ